MVLPIDQDKLLKTAEEKGRVWVIGTYGTGKGLIAEWVAREATKNKDLVVRLSLRDLPVPLEADIPLIAGYNSYASWHAEWRKQAEKAKVTGQKLWIIIEEAQQLVPHGAGFWEILLSLAYYQQATVRLVVCGSPSLLSCREMAIGRLKRGVIINPRSLDMDETREIVEDHSRDLGFPLLKYLPSINRLAHGHYGTIKYVCQLIAENNFTGTKVTETKIEEWANTRGDMAYFLDYVWKGLSCQQQAIIRKWIANRGKGLHKDEAQVREMVDVGLWYLGGREVSWRIPWIDTVVRKYVIELGEGTRRDYLSSEELAGFGEKEVRIMNKLMAQRNDVVTYGQLGDVVWSKNSAHYSQWALAQLVARVRKKLAVVAPDMQIVTVRGEGWKLV